MSTDEEYPSARKDLFGNGHVANLWCAFKWVFWHLFHLLYVVFVGAFLVVAVPLLLIYRGAKYAATRTAHWTAGRLGPRTGRVATRTTVTLAAAGRTAKSRPVTRHIYGECPVDIKIDPRWFERLEAVGARVIKWAEPPETVWVCDDCGEVSDLSFQPSGCFNCHGRDFTEVRETEVDREEDILTDGGAADGVVYVTGRGSGGPRVYHESAECHNLQKAKNRYKKDPDILDVDAKPCGSCVDEEDEILTDGGETLVAGDEPDLDPETSDPDELVGRHIRVDWGAREDVGEIIEVRVHKDRARELRIVIPTEQGSRVQVFYPGTVDCEIVEVSNDG